MMMKTLIRTSAASFALAAMLSSAALASEPMAQPEEPELILNNQLQFGDVFGHMVVVTPIEGATGPVSSAGQAFGNVVSVETTQFERVQSYQENGGDIDAKGYVFGTDIDGDVSSQSVAYANSGTFALDGATADRQVFQIGQGDDTAVAAETRIDINEADNVAGASVAVDNIIASSVNQGDYDGNIQQESYSRVTAETTLDIHRSGNSTVATATATGSSYDHIADESRNLHDVKQTARSPAIRAFTTVEQDYGVDITAASSATTNSTVIDSAWGYTQANVEQRSNTTVVADTSVTLENWDGTAVLSSYGVGNSTITYNTGSPTDLDVQQFNSGQIYAQTDFDTNGGAGGQVITSNTAIGNAYTGTACQTCSSSATIGGSIRQVNQANISAYGHTTANGANGVIGASTAIGNSASYSTVRD